MTLRRCWSLVEMEVRELLSSVPILTVTMQRVIKGSALKALEGDAAAVQKYR
jgi:translation elongation factor EF-Tu-like GTPase